MQHEFGAKRWQMETMYGWPPLNLPQGIDLDQNNLPGSRQEYPHISLVKKKKV